jgi:hypothetical protein
MQHHARLFVTPNPEQIVAGIKSTDSSSSEIIEQRSDTLSIDEVRRIIQLAYQTPGEKSFRLILIITRQIAHEAQNALLKILEEPPVTTRFAVVMPSTAGLLPTVLSRLTAVFDTTGSELSALFTSFVTLDVKERLDMIADIVKRKADDDYTALYNGLVTYVATNRLPTALLPLVQASFLQLRQKGASKKLVWEELALSLPKAE